MTPMERLAIERWERAEAQLRAPPPARVPDDVVRSANLWLRLASADQDDDDASAKVGRDWTWDSAREATRSHQDRVRDELARREVEAGKAFVMLKTFGCKTVRTCVECGESIHPTTYHRCPSCRASICDPEEEWGCR